MVVGKMVVGKMVVGEMVLGKMVLGIMVVGKMMVGNTGKTDWDGGKMVEGRGVWGGGEHGKREEEKELGCEGAGQEHRNDESVRAVATSRRMLR
eukprot:736264-Pleurochrysis_carterae.AAC.1